MPAAEMSSPAPVAVDVRMVRLSAGQCLTVHLERGAVLHVEQGSVTVADAPRWLAGQMAQFARNVNAGDVCVTDSAGWHQILASGPVLLRIAAPAPRPGLWSLIKSRFGRSGLLLGNARPPDTQAAEPSVPHATSQ